MNSIAVSLTPASGLMKVPILCFTISPKANFLRKLKRWIFDGGHQSGDTAASAAMTNRAAILNGRLLPRQKLPSTRSIAQSLRFSHHCHPAMIVCRGRLPWHCCGSGTYVCVNCPTIWCSQFQFIFRNQCSWSSPHFWWSGRNLRTPTLQPEIQLPTPAFVTDDRRLL